MKLLLIGNQASTIILFRKKIIELLVSKNITVHTLTMDHDSEKFEHIKNIGAEPGQYSFSRSGINPFKETINTIKLVKKIKLINPDIVLCFFPKPVIFGSIAAKIAGVNRIYTLLEGLGFCFTIHPEKESLKKKILRKVQTILYKLSLPLSAEVFFLNNDDYQDLVVRNNIKVTKAEVIGGIGVNLSEFLYKKPENDNIHFGMVSRLLIDKGVREFVEAAKIIKSKYPNVQFSIAGSIDDNPGGISKEQIELWKKENVVNFMGQISDVKTYLANLSVFILPSYREGVPRSTQEAMSVGRAIITTDVPGCRETIINGLNGILIPPWNTNELVKAMMHFMHNPELILTMGRESRKIAEEKFDENDAANKLINIMLNYL